jgi:hypothetical protein
LKSGSGWTCLRASNRSRGFLANMQDIRKLFMIKGNIRGYLQKRMGLILPPEEAHDGPSGFPRRCLGQLGAQAIGVEDRRDKGDLLDVLTGGGGRRRQSEFVGEAWRLVTRSLILGGTPATTRQLRSVEGVRLGVVVLLEMSVCSKRDWRRRVSGSQCQRRRCSAWLQHRRRDVSRGSDGIQQGCAVHEHPIL